MNNCTCPEWISNAAELCPDCLREFERDMVQIGLADMQGETCDSI